jgi:hypothetical protein
MDTRLPVYPHSYGRSQGWCGALYNDEAECDRVAGHLADGVPHSTRGPYGARRVWYDDTGRRICGVEVIDHEGRHRWCAKHYGHAPEPAVGLRLHEAPAPPGALYREPWAWWGDDPWKELP